MHELTAQTESGAALVALAEHLAEDFALRAAEHDRAGSFPFENVAALREAAYFTAPVPTEHGGLGVTNLHDLAVASSRLARGDASLTIGVNMHLVAVLNMARLWERATRAGDSRRAAALASSFRSIVEGTVFAAAVSEPNQHLTRPATRATRTEGGWRIEGRKVFVTMAPAATVFYTAVTFVDDRGRERYGYAFVPAATPGVVVGDDWDALGMRASGSYSVTFEGAEVPAAALGGGFAVGDTRAYMERNLTAGAFHAAASLGIAEAASRAAIDAVVARGNGHRDGRTRQLAADSAIRLSASRAVLARASTLADDWYTDGRTGRDPDAVVSLFAEVQSAKAFVTETAVAIVDDALALTGGAGYMNGHPLSRAYRDVRAGGFMHPLGDNRAYDFVGDVALAAEPALG